jgi:hypothetical protein
MSLDIWHALFVGFYLGAVASWFFNRKPPVIKDAQITANLTVTPEVPTQVNAAITMAWLDKQGLTWMPKGAVFDPHKEANK